MIQQLTLIIGTCINEKKAKNKKILFYIFVQIRHNRLLMKRIYYALHVSFYVNSKCASKVNQNILNSIFSTKSTFY